MVILEAYGKWKELESMAETTTVQTTSEEPPAPATSAETTAIAERLGEHNVQLQETAQTAEEAVTAANSAAAAAAAANAPHSHEDYVTKGDLSAAIDGLGSRLESVLKPAEPEPPAVAAPAPEPPGDEVPKSRERTVKKKTLAQRFYGKS